MKYRKIIISLLPVLGIALSLFSSPGCANTAQAPQGGPKDTLAPILLRTSPPEDAINVKPKRVELFFNEFIHISDANTQILLSPPQRKKPTARSKGKGVLVQFAYPLDSGVTYCLYFGNALADNNEGNAFPNYALSFSSGGQLDSMMLSGLVVDAYTMLPQSGATVVLHKQVTDTTVQKCLPAAVTRTDDWGYFCFRNLPDTTFRIFVFKDDNNDYKYDPDNDYVAFCDHAVRPTKVMTPGSKELHAFDPKDTLGLLSRPIETTLYTFTTDPTRQVLKERTRIRDRQFVLKFGAPNPEIISLQIEGVDSSHIIRQYNHKKDSIQCWIHQKQLPDTLRCICRYMGTDDSLKILVPIADTFKLKPVANAAGTAEGQQAEDNRRPGRAGRPNIGGTKKEDENPHGVPGDGNGGQARRKDLLDAQLKADEQSVEQEGILLIFPSFPVKVDMSGASLTHITTKKDTIRETVTLSRNPFDSLIYHLRPRRWETATEYQLMIPARSLRDVNEYTNDTLSLKFSTPNPDKFSALEVNAVSVKKPYIIDLMDESRTKIMRSHWINADTTVVFPYLQPGKVSLRVTEDLNGNRIWDNGDFPTRRGAEKVRVYRLPDGAETIEIRENTDLSQTLDMEKLMNQHVKLTPSKKSGNKRR